MKKFAIIFMIIWVVSMISNSVLAQGDCTGNEECDDSNPCTDDICIVGAGCQYSNNTEPCDDGLFCNGTDTCNAGACSAHAGDPCAGADGDADCSESCNEAADSCTSADPNGSACDDGAYCNGTDTCNAGTCSAHAGDPCAGADGDADCSESCNEAADSCTSADPNGSACDDGVACTTIDICSGGVCNGTPRNVLCFDDNVCTDDICTVGIGCSNPNNTLPCDDGLFCTQTDSCNGSGICAGSNDPCWDNGEYCDGIEYCEEHPGNYNCLSTGNPCSSDSLTCDEEDNVCDTSDVTLSLGESFGSPGTIAIGLVNELNQVSEVTLSVCDRDRRPWLLIDSTLCTLTARAPDSDFTCTLTDMENHCVQVFIVGTVSAAIATGTGAIALLSYTLDPNAPSGEFADLNPENTTVREDSVRLTVTPVPGRIGAVECIDDAQCEDGISCTVDSCNLGSFTCLHTPDNGLCDDTVGCTDDTCDETLDCQHLPNDANCDDGIGCTDNVCDQADDCRYVPNDATCDDDVFCTDDSCNAVSDCQHIPNDAHCHDNNICTEDNCDIITGCDNQPLANGTACNDGFYCNGSDTCSEGICKHTGNPCPEGTTCNESQDMCTSVLPTTTTTPVTSCAVVISPDAQTVESTEIISFSAVTTCDGVGVVGTYLWEIIPASTIGSSIVDDAGLYTAGNNTTSDDVTETVRVIDITKNVTDTAQVVVKRVLPVCETSIEPSAATIDSEETIAFTAATGGMGCLIPDYTWQLETAINSKLLGYADWNNATCFYQAGANETGMLHTDTLTVFDRANGTSTQAAVTVSYGRIKRLIPRLLFSSRWVPLSYIVYIIGEDTAFNPAAQLVFNPGESLTTIGKIVFDNFMVVMLIVSPYAEEELIDLEVTLINGEGQEVTFAKEDAFWIRPLPFILDKQAYKR